jgi:hypothetical protein
MANVNNPHGFHPLMRSILGGPGAACLAAHKIVGVAAALYIGDAVQLQGSGVKNNPSIIAAAAASAIYGVNLVHGLLSTLTDHIIIPILFQLFEVQIDTCTVAQLQYNAQLVATTGDTGTHLSKQSLNSIATTNTHELKLLGLYQDGVNVVGSYARVVVTCNQSQMQDQIAGV